MCSLYWWIVGGILLTLSLAISGGVCLGKARDAHLDSFAYPLYTAGFVLLCVMGAVAVGLIVVSCVACCNEGGGTIVE